MQVYKDLNIPNFGPNSNSYQAIKERYHSNSPPFSPTGKRGLLCVRRSCVQPSMTDRLNYLSGPPAKQAPLILPPFLPPSAKVDHGLSHARRTCFASAEHNYGKRARTDAQSQCITATLPLLFKLHVTKPTSQIWTNRRRVM